MTQPGVKKSATEEFFDNLREEKGDAATPVKSTTDEFFESLERGAETAVQERPTPISREERERLELEQRGLRPGVDRPPTPFEAMTPRRPLETGLDVVGRPFQALTNLARPSFAFTPFSTLAEQRDVETTPGASAFQRLYETERGQPISSQIQAGLMTDPTIFLPGIGVVGKASVVPRKLGLAAIPEARRIPFAGPDVAFAVPSAPGTAPVPKAVPAPRILDAPRRTPFILEKPRVLDVAARPGQEMRREIVGGAGIRQETLGSRATPFKPVQGAEITSQGIRAVRTIRQSVDDVAGPEHIENINAVRRGEVPPDNPAELLQKVSRPEGKPRLSDPPSFPEEIGIQQVTGRLPRLARGLATAREGPITSGKDFIEAAIRNPIVRAIMRWTPGGRNPALFAESNTQRAGLVRAALIDDGRQKISGLTAHARQFGTQDDLFGRTLESTGLLESGPFKGRSVNEIAENPSKFKLNDAQRKWIDSMSGLETEIHDFLVRNGVDVGEVRSANIERYAGRIHVARVLADGSIIESGGIGRRGLAGKIGAEKERIFETVVEAQKEGFVPLSYEQSFVARAQSAYNRVVNKQTSEWIQRNLPPDVELRARLPGDSVQFGETINLPDFPGLVAEGPATQRFVKDLQGMFPTVGEGPLLSLARGFNQFNMVQRLFALAGDQSLMLIQFIILAARHPIVFGKATIEFEKSLFYSTLKPAGNRTRRAKFLADNAEIIQDSPGLILSESGFEFTESLAVGGFLSPQGLYKGTNPILKVVGRIPGTAAGILRPFQQAFESSMDDAGVNLMKALRHMGTDPQRKRDVVDYVNNMRGLSSSARLGLTPNQRLAESVILLAPRYRRAVAALHANLIQGGLRGDLARNAYMALFAGVVSTYVGLSYALGAAQGKTEKQIREQVKRGINPGSREFLLWRAGNTAFGVGSKINSDLRLLARIATDPGAVGDFAEFNRNVGVRWVRSQLGASPSTGWNYLVGSNYLGEPITRDIFGRPVDTLKSLGKTLGENTTFLWLQAALFEGGTREERVLKGATEFFGGRAYPFPGPTYDDVADALYGKSFDKLGVPGSKFHSKEQRRVVDEWNKIISPSKRTELEEGAAERKVAREELSRNIQERPGSQRRLHELGQQFQ